MEVQVEAGLNISEIRQQFPILHQSVNGHKLIYFDNAATTQKPKSVIDSLISYYVKDNANIHRGIHTLAERATSAFEATRSKISHYIHAKESDEILFTRGTTEGINLVAQSYARKFLKAGDEIVLTIMEHHSNIVPWQMVAQQTGATLKFIPINERQELDWESGQSLITEKTKIVSLVYISNALGTINPVKKIISKAHQFGAVVMIDGAQAAPHLKIDVQDIDCDFLALSAHKMYGPTGIGCLYGKRKWLEKMDPYQGGGEMIRDVKLDKTTYNDIPYKFEAGTPNIADVVAWKESIEFIESIGIENVAKHENELLEFATLKLNEIEGLTLIGKATNKASVASFVLDRLHHFDVGILLDAQGIAVRTGHHCTQPLMDNLSIEGTIRASFAVYNTFEEIDIFIEKLQEIVKKRRK